MLIVERRDSVLLITLNRPKKRNSLHPDLIRELADTLTQTETDETLYAVVVTGAGTSFCAGLDLTHLLSLDAEDKFAYVQTAFALFHRLYTLPQPVIAAVMARQWRVGLISRRFAIFDCVRRKRNSRKRKYC